MIVSEKQCVEESIGMAAIAALWKMLYFYV